MQDNSIQENMMPVMPPADYIPLINTIIGNWQQVNIALGGTPATELKLKGNYAIANLTADRDALQVRLSDVQTKLNLREDAAANREVKKTALRGRMTEFRNAVQYQLQGTQYTAGLPTLPAATSFEGRYLRSFDDMATKWTIINALAGVPNFTPPLLLLGGYPIATFNTDLTDLRAAFANVRNTSEALTIAIKTRDDSFKPIYARLKEYILAVKARFPANSPLVEALPRLTPKPSGTPKAVVQPIIAYDDVKKAAVVTFKASPTKSVTSYELRYSPDIPYKSENETTVATTDTTKLELETTEGLKAPGDEANYKVYAITDDGNAKGSKTLLVKRPL
jgi:hypothetical protein